MTIEERSKETQSVRMDVLMDGWSYLTTNGEVVWDAGPIEGAELEFSPVTSDDVQALLETTPQIVELAIARQITPAADVKCSAEGCTSSHDIDLGWIESPQSVPTFGETYAALGMESLLYLASVEVPAGFALTAVRSPSDTDPADDLLLSVRPLELFEGETPNQLNGYWRNRTLISGAFGQLWPTETAWLSSLGGEDFFPNLFTGQDTNTATLVAASQAEPPIEVFRGLSHPWEGSSGLNASQLTYYSSPTSGCGPVTVCSPAVENWSESSLSETVPVCPATGSGPELAVSMSFGSVSFTSAAPLSQFGAWDGFTPAEFEDIPGSGGVNGGGFPPLLASGQHTLYTSTFNVWQGPNPAQVRAASGKVTEFSEGQKSLTELLADGILLGVPYKICD